MKKLFGMLLLSSILAIAAPAVADTSNSLYVAPKLMLNFVQMDGVKVTASKGAISESLSIGDKTDVTFGASIAMGYDFKPKFSLPIRSELEFAVFSKAEAKKTFHDGGDSDRLKQAFNIQTLFANVYWDIETGTQLTPYIGAGLGLAFINTKLSYSGENASETWGASTGSKSITNFVWNLGFGFGYEVLDNFTLDAGYRFSGLGSVKTKTFSYDGADAYGKTKNLYQHQLSFGVRYSF